MLEKLPANYIPHEVRDRLKKMGAIAPMNIFLRQEIDRMQRVITIVRTSLQDLQLAIEGTIIMSEVSFKKRKALQRMHAHTNHYSLNTMHFYYCRTFEMHWTVYMMPKSPRSGERLENKTVSITVTFPNTLIGTKESVLVL